MSSIPVSPREPSPFPLISTRNVYRNPWITVREDHVGRPGGGEGIFGVVTMKPGASVLPITADLQTFLTREYKYAIGRHSIEVASGAMEDGETPLDCAKRELEEELGLQAREWIDAGRIDPFTTVVSSTNFMFIALDLQKTSPRPDAGEVLSAIQLPFNQALDLVMAGEITHGASCVLILKAQALLKQRAMLK